MKDFDLDDKQFKYNFMFTICLAMIITMIRMDGEVELSIVESMLYFIGISIIIFVIPIAWHTVMFKVKDKQDNNWIQVKVKR